MGVRGGLRGFLRRHRLVGADSMVFIYHLENHPRYSPLTEMIFGQWEIGKTRGITSVISLGEILVRPLRDGSRRIAEEYRRLLLSFPHLSVVDVDRHVAVRAADLRAGYGLRTPDAMQIAAALRHGATGFISNDETVKRVRDMEVLLLDEVIPRR